LAKTRADIEFIELSIAQEEETPLYRQIFKRVRDAVISGQLRTGDRLPSSRTLAKELGVSRNTVSLAYEQLAVEGFIECRVGGGSWVAKIPGGIIDMFTNLGTDECDGSPGPRPRKTSNRASLITATPIEEKWPARRHNHPLAFRVGLPAMDLFPFDVWSMTVGKTARAENKALAVRTDTSGLRRLREAVASYLALSRGVICSSEQVLIVPGAQGGLDLTLRLLLDAGEKALIEDPSYLGIRGALVGAGAKAVPVPIDDEGFDIAKGEALAPDARLAVVTPSHQFPMAVTMSLKRRAMLLEWANRMGGWIVEDDYDSEFRYASRPLSPLMSLDTEGRVIYIGTFSKVIYPALRLGYLVVPEDMIDAFVALQRFSNASPPVFEQAVVASFIEQGHFARHISRMRQVYKSRGESLRSLLAERFGDLAPPAVPSAGMHMILPLQDCVCDQLVARCAAELGVDVRPLSMYSMREKRSPALALGYACVPESRMAASLDKLMQAIRAAVK
jgi:GntR family transcriptional regulator / MocR family aminotransferase